MDLESPDRPEYDILRKDSLPLDVVEEAAPPPPPKSSKRSFSSRIKNNKRALLVLFVILLLLGLSFAGFIFIKKGSSSKPPTNVVINTQSLDNGTLNQISSGEGGVKQQLTISPDTIFKSNVLVQGNGEVLKNLTVGGSVDIQNTATVRDSLTVGKSLSVGTNLTVNGIVTAASLNVGSITISSINVSGNLIFGGHLIPGGAAPTVKASVAAGGGTVTISGNDTSGTIVINTGSSSMTPGEMAIITFHTAFATVPKVQITPIGEKGSSLRYYATRSANLFTINTGTAAAPNTMYAFDYLVTQ